MSIMKVSKERLPGKRLRPSSTIKNLYALLIFIKDWPKQPLIMPKISSRITPMVIKAPMDPPLSIGSKDTAAKGKEA